MIKHIVTLGFGPGASGTAFLPTLGFASSGAPAPPAGSARRGRLLLLGVGD